MTRIYTSHWNDYELIDAGNNQKLERWGDIVTIRPERNAYFTPVLNKKEWESRAHFRFNEETRTKGNWEQLKPGIKKQWKISCGKSVFNLKLTQFKHLGIFPEQKTNWDFIREHLNTDERFLNLFGYTGGASIVAKARGADVYHCDSVKQINAWAKENMESSGLSDIRWVHDDALKFAQRELKRGNKYKGVIMDPPAYGIGAKKERWKIENKFQELLEVAMGLLESDGFLIANTYSPRLKAEKIKKVTNELVQNKRVEIATLSIKSTTGKTLEYGELTRIS